MILKPSSWQNLKELNVKKHEYLKLVLTHHDEHYNPPYLKKTWFLTAFAIIQEGPEDWKQDPYLYRLVQSPSGISFVNSEQQLELIEDAKPGIPLFTFKEPIEVDADWAININEAQSTTVGRLLVNQITIASIFGNRIPFFNKSFKVGAVEDIIAKKLKNTPSVNEVRDTESIYIDEYNQFVNRLTFIASLAPLCNYSATEKNIVAPKGVVQYREQLIKEYGDKLTDPVYLAEFESKLKAYADEYLKDDPSNNIFLAGKAKNNGYRKLFLDFGADAQIRPSYKVTPITKPLCEGWDTNPKEFSSMMNSLRAGSYARGMETVNGGVTAKSILRSLSAFKILQEDCGTKLTLTRTFSEIDYDRLVDRYILLNNKWILVTEEMAKSFINKPVQMRSPIYCKSEKETFCKYCVGEKLALSQNGLALAATDVSSTIISSSMAAMHGKVLETAHFDYNQLLT